eukprot:TRINITY_DN4518_c0_g1_i2.p4 TRINITY_DN4518_c0_g1~~TRINITY_DN4518_c0_g1_i2.p4  ORF type:complete len:150 (-),score=29.43 TRINITY_DN4518_c0_g1_i2:168-617(-)
MRMFQEERFNVSKIKPDNLVCNSPLITGRNEAIEGEITSPNFGVTPRNQINRQDGLHRRAMLKNLAQNGFGALLGNVKPGPKPQQKEEEENNLINKKKMVSGVKNRLKNLESLKLKEKEQVSKEEQPQIQPPQKKAPKVTLKQFQKLGI